MNREIRNAKIAGTMLGEEAHGIMTAYLYLEYGGGGQGFGGYGLDAWNETLKKRIGCDWGMEFIKQVLKIVGVEKWESLVGEHIRVDAEHTKVHGIGNIIRDEWFYPTKDLKYLLSEEKE